MPTDSTMGHAHLGGCDGAMMLGACSSAEKRLMASLMCQHGEVAV